MSSLEHESESLWKHHPALAWATLTTPVWLSIGILSLAYIAGGIGLVRDLVIAVIAAAATGRFVILGGEVEGSSVGFSPIQLAVLVFYLDIIWAIVLTWHAGLLFHVPWLGERIKAAVQEGNLLLKRNRWMRSITVGAVFAFVMLPISSTGSIGGSLLGRLLGLSRIGTFAIVVLGSICGGAAMLLGAEALRPWFDKTSVAVRYGGIAIVVLLCFVLSGRYRRTLKN